MMELPHDFGTVEDGEQERPGPIETLVRSLAKADQHTLSGAEVSLAHRIDRAIVETAGAIHQLRPDEHRFGTDTLRKVVIVTTLGGIHDLDEVVELAEALSPFGCEHYADNAFNFRNLAVPYKPGDAHYDEEADR